jgi:peptidylprolyl isomerase
MARAGLGSCLVKTPRSLASTALAFALAATLAACGSATTTTPSTSSTPQTPDPSASFSTATGAPASTGPLVQGTAGVTVTGAMGSKPVVKLGADTAKTTDLTYSDITVGTGAAVTAADTVTAQYVGIGASTGKQFDSSWDRGKPATFPLNSVIEGWQRGLPGMKIGGRRLLVIPGAQAYADSPPQGSGIQPNEVLVFVVDLVPTPQPTVGPHVEGTAGVTVTGALGSAPTIAVSPETAQVTQLTLHDIAVGTGPEVKPGASVTVQYVGVGAASGKKFDSSWDRGQPASFPLSGVIQGWQNGIPGMKVGGRRLLVIPGDQAYGANPPQGSSIGANEALVFVVDVVSSP